MLNGICHTMSQKTLRLPSPLPGIEKISPQSLSTSTTTASTIISSAKAATKSRTISPVSGKSLSLHTTHATHNTTEYPKTIGTLKDNEIKRVAPLNIKVDIINCKSIVNEELMVKKDSHASSQRLERTPTVTSLSSLPASTSTTVNIIANAINKNPNGVDEMEGSLNGGGDGGNGTDVSGAGGQDLHIIRTSSNHQLDRMSLQSISSEDISTSAKGRCCGAATRNPGLKTGRRLQLMQMIILPFIPILALIIQTSFMLEEILKYRAEVADIETQVTIATDLGKVVTRLQLERTEVAFFVFTNGSRERSNLTQRFDITDQALNNMTTWSEVTVPTSPDDDDFEVKLNRTEFINRLNDFRDRIRNEPEDSSITDVMNWYTSINRGFMNSLNEQIKETDNSGVWRYLVGFKNLLKSIECQNIASSLGIKYFGRGSLGQENFVTYIRYEYLARELLNSTLNYVPFLRPMYVNITKLVKFKSMKSMTSMVLKNNSKAANKQDAILYYDTMHNYTDDLRILQKALRKRIKEYVDATLLEAAKKEAIGITILVVVLCVSPIIIILVENAAATIQMYALNLAQKAKELKREKRKSDSLLFQMLPPSVAMQLKQTQQVPAELYESATIYFSDIVGFTEIAAKCTPLEVVTFLNSIYRVFDERIECYDVYKVETIGDSYMVASGLPVKNGNKHVSEIATMALDLLDASTCFKIPRSNDILQIRCGVHTGPVVAGIVGTKMPRYCLFGDTVNTASRMESTGEAQKIHITEQMNEALVRVGGFKTEPRGLIDVKGKGLMSTYWLTCKDGPVKIREEVSWFGDMQPVFLENLKMEPSFKLRKDKNK